MRLPPKYKCDVCGREEQAAHTIKRWVIPKGWKESDTHPEHTCDRCIKSKKKRTQQSKMRKKLAAAFDEAPETCGECPFYSEHQYQCHNERGTEAGCRMGYMKGDMRDKTFRKRRYKGCKLGT